MSEGEALKTTHKAFVTPAETYALGKCPDCGYALTHWSDSGLSSYGWACLVCKKWFTQSAGSLIVRSLLEVPFPRSHRQIPLYRTAVGWIDGVCRCGAEGHIGGDHPFRETGQAGLGVEP